MAGIHTWQLGDKQFHCIISVRNATHKSKELSKLTHETRDIPLVTTAYVIWKFYKGTKIIDLKDIPLTEALERAQQDYEPEPKLPRWRKIVGFLWD